MHSQSRSSAREGGVESQGEDFDRLRAAVERLTGIVDHLWRSSAAEGRSQDLSARIQEVRDLLREPGRPASSGSARGASSSSASPRATSSARPETSPESREDRPYRGETGGQSHL
jgi:hypothetical protein